MNERILCVDDDPNILQAYQRSLRRQFSIEPALGGEEALAAVTNQGPYAVVVSDMRMPGMDGVELLSKVRQLAPDTVRMMLTGNADQQTATHAVNEGHIFRFLNKPCPPEDFAKALRAAIEQHRLITAEREILTKTLAGSIKVLSDVLGLVNPAAFGRASRVHRLVGQLCRQLSAEKGWLIEIAALLSQIGCVAVPEETLSRVYKRQDISQAEARVFLSHPATGRDLLTRIPRLEEAAEIVAYQEKLYDGKGFPEDDLRGDQLPLGSRILKVALDWDMLVVSGMSEDMAMAQINDRQGWYDPAVVEGLRGALNIQDVHVLRRVRVHEMVDGAVLADDVRSIHGTLLCARGQEVNPSMRARLKSYLTNVGVQGPIKILVSADEAWRFPESGMEAEPGPKTEVEATPRPALAPKPKHKADAGAVNWDDMFNGVEDEPGALDQALDGQ